MKQIEKIALKPREVAAMYGMPEGTLANLRWRKCGPPYYRKPGGRGVFYLRKDIESWLLSQPVQTTQSIETDRAGIFPRAANIPEHYSQLDFSKEDSFHSDGTTHGVGQK